MEDCPVFCPGVEDEDYARTLQALPACFNRDSVVQVRCRRQSPGWYGALVCNKQVCQEALRYFDALPSSSRKARDVYISIEAQARPTLRFSSVALQDVIDSFRASADPFVHISVLPIPAYGWPRRHVYSHVYEQQSSLLQLSTAILCSREFAASVVQLDTANLNSPFDVYLARSGYSRLVMYPAAFQRSSGPSLASKTPLLDLSRQVIGNRYVFVAGEFACHYTGRSALLLVVLVAALVALLVRGARSRSRW